MLFDVCASMVLFLISLRNEVYQLSNVIRLKQKGSFRCCRACYRFTSSITPFYSGKRANRDETAAASAAAAATDAATIEDAQPPSKVRTHHRAALMSLFYTLAKVHSSSSKEFLHSKELGKNLT